MFFMFFIVPYAVAAGALTTAAIATLKNRGRAGVSTQSPGERALARRLGLLPPTVSVAPPVARTETNSLQPTGWRGFLEHRSEEERKAFGTLKLAGAGVGLGVAGIFFFPLQIAGVACLLPIIVGDFKDAYRSLVVERRVNGPVLISVFITAAALGGFFVSLTLAASFVVAVRWLALKTEDHSKQGIVDLFGRQIRSVWMVVDGVEMEVPVEQVKTGDLIMIQAGEMAAMDGVIVEGNASIDQRSLTGEAQPAEKAPGDRVLAATVVLSGRICVQVEKTGEQTAAAQVGRALTDTRDYKEGLVSRADAFNDRMSLPMLLVSGISFPFIGLGGALGILNATPGYRMVLYGPLSMLSYLHVAAQRGILIKDGRSLELLRGIDTVVFDKTGTLTLEQPGVARVVACPGFTEESVLTWAAAAETKQTHPIARAILAAAEERGIQPPAIEDSEYDIGYGITVKVESRTIRVGSQRFLAMHGVKLPPDIEALQSEAHRLGNSLVLMGVDAVLAGAIVLQATIRPEAHAVIGQLRDRGVKLYIVSGDHQGPTGSLAVKLGIDGYFAGVLPEDKGTLVRRLQGEGRKVCFVGDGINDSIALKAADVSVSLNGATTIAIDKAQIVLMHGDLTELPQIFTLADEFGANMRINLYAATVPSALVIGGVLFLGLGLLPSVLLYQSSVPFALYNTLRPLIHRSKGQLPPAGSNVLAKQEA